MPADRTFFLITTRLGFRCWRRKDFDLAYGLWGDPRVARWIDVRGRLSDAQVRERLAREIQLQKDHGVQYWPLFRLDTAEHVGCCGLRPHDPEHGVYELGFHICAPSWRKGYAREAARAVIKYAFDTLRVATLFAGHHPNNSASRQLLTQLGFQYTHDEYYAATGCQHPSYRLDPTGWTPAEAAPRPPAEAESPAIRIEKDPVELNKLLKYARLVQSGGEAKHLIARGDIRVNGRIETRKRKKIVAGDRIAFAGRIYRVKVRGREAS